MSNQKDTDWDATKLLTGHGHDVVRVKGVGSGDAVVIWARGKPGSSELTAVETLLSGYSSHQHAA